MRKLLVLIVPLCVAAAACSSSPAYGEEDLEGIVLQLDEAPAGTQFVESQSGAFTAEELTSDENQLAQLEGEGLIAAFDAIFASPGLAGVEGTITRSGAIIVDSSAFVFESLDGAMTSFARLERDIRDSFGGVGTIFPIVVDDLGDEALAVRIEFFRAAAGPDVGVLYSWRVENLIVRLAVFGEMLDEIADVRPIADVVQSHTSS